MGAFLADLHIHSRFSRATSKDLTFRNLAAWAGIKGLDVLGTGDFTHPGWLEMLEEELEPEEGGLFRLKNSQGLNAEIPGMEDKELPCRTRFLLSTEISSIYKRGGKVRKVHNLVFMPNLDCVKKFNARLAQIGNIASDGRPILGLDSRNLLEMVLETHPEAHLVPAHIWTPWFSVFGSKSGFDTLEECFGDLTSEIFALETGLSSDPAMNWLWSGLDKYTLISNSDAHSGANLGREANVFHGARDYTGIFRALKGQLSATEFRGTIEFYPEEGKYHLDGHRKCALVLDPRETVVQGNICPVCGKPLTIGVLNRILQLADRTTPVRPVGHPGFTSLIPLPEIISEIVGTGPKSKKVRKMYLSLIERFGSEMQILRSVPLEDLKRRSSPLAEGIARLRADHVIKQGGFDGQYGVISVFSRQERAEFKHGKTLMPVPAPCRPAVTNPSPVSVSEPASCGTPSTDPQGTYAPNPLQQQAIDAGPEPVLVLTGPGTGKTQTLMGRITRLLEQGEDPEKILVVTFTRRAAREIRERLASGTGDGPAPRADTLHALAFAFWTAALGEPPVLLSEDGAKSMFAAANPELKGQAFKNAWQSMNRDRELERAGSSPQYVAYARQKSVWNLVDYTDLLEFWLEQIQGGGLEGEYTHVLVDEVQDLSPLQLSLVSGLASAQGKGFFAIGDPNQSIYGFRGAVADVHKRLAAVWPDVRTVSLEKNYRSTQEILDLAGGLFPDASGLVAMRPDSGRTVLFKAATAPQEAAWIGGKILTLIGGTAHWQADGGNKGGLGPGDIAVLVRFKALIPLYRKTFESMGIPCSVPETEAFFREPRVDKILRQAGSVMGIGSGEVEEVCPDAILAQGPEKIAAYVGDTPPFDRFFWSSGPFKKLVASFREQGSWAGVLNRISLENELENIRSSAQKVQIMSLHGAKGLEFDAVFLPALEEGIIPFAGVDILTGKPEGQNVRSDVQEERRLLYVGLTRARQRVYLSHSKQRKIFGHSLHSQPSRFLQDLPADKVSVRAARPHKKIQEKQMMLF